MVVLFSAVYLVWTATHDHKKRRGGGGRGEKRRGEEGRGQGLPEKGT